MNAFSRRNFLRQAGAISGLAALEMGLPSALNIVPVERTLMAQAQAAAPWYTHEFIADSLMNERIIWFLAHTWERMAEVSEVLDTLTRITSGDSASWRAEWFKTADRLRKVADEALAKGHTISAGETYLRVTGYDLAGLVYASSPNDPDVRPRAQDSTDAFQKALKLLGIPGEYVEIPYENSALPAYFFRSPLADGKAPVLIVHQGQDASVEENLFVAEGCIKRGYHCLLLHHPGQGLALRLKGLPFRPDWEKVITPVVDYLVAKPEVDADRIALMGLSFGGSLVLRAAAFEQRLKIVIANPAVYSWWDWFKVYLFGDHADFAGLLDSDPEAFNAAYAQFLTSSPESAMYQWWTESAMWKYGASSPADLMIKLRAYTNVDIIDRVSCNVLVMDGENEWVAPEHARLAYDALKCPKTYMLFEAESTASLHCQTGAMAVASQRMFDWFDENI